MKIKDLKLDEGLYITRITYKPSWKIHFVRDTQHARYKITLFRQDTSDASKFKFLEDYKNHRELQEKIPLILSASLSEEVFSRMPEKEFFGFIFEQIISAEIHEIKEWFKVDGLYLKNPHPGDFAPGINEIECFK